MGLFEQGLNHNGLQQARRAADALSSYEFATIYTSPLSRALQTADIIKSSQPQACRLVVAEDLRERDFGEMEGKTKTQKDRERLDSIKTVESTEGLKQRLGRVINLIGSNSGNSLIVSHSAVYRQMVISGLVRPIDNIDYLANAQWVVLLQTPASHPRRQPCGEL